MASLQDEKCGRDVPSEAPSEHSSAVQQKSSSFWKHLFAFTNPKQICVIVCAVGTACVVAACKTVYTLILGRIFGVVAKFGSEAITGQQLLDQVSQWSLYLTVLGLGMWALSGMDMALWITSGELRAASVRTTLFSALIQKEMGWFDSRDDGMSSLVITTQGRVRELQNAAAQSLGFLVYDTLVFISCLIVAFYFSWKLTLVILSTCVPSIIILFLINRKLEPAIRAQKQELAHASKHAVSAFSAIELVKVYNGEGHEQWQYTQSIKRAASHYFRQALCNCLQMGYIKLWMNMLVVFGFYFAVILAQNEGLTPGNALTTFYAVITAFQALEAVGPHWLILAKGMAAGQHLKELVEDVPRRSDGTLSDKSGYRPLRRCDGDIELREVSFAYPSTPSRQVVAPCNMFFPAGDATFLVGRSGSGKSTLGNLLIRFYEPTSGNITLDGMHLERLDVGWLRSNVTLIQQSSILFNDSLGNNVALGAGDLSSITTDDVLKACGVALLQSTIAALPEGLDTKVGPGGYSLSGGQRQRVGLARARLRDTPVLILDEVTSGLDPANRSLIMDALRLWRRGKTTIIITHEVAQIEDHEYVYVMDNGQLVQEGYKKGLVTDEEGLFASLLAAADQQNANSSEESGIESETESDSEEEEEYIDEEVQPPKPAHVYDSRFSKMFRGLYENSNQTAPFNNSRLSIGVATSRASRMRRKELWDAPLEEKSGSEDELRGSRASSRARRVRKHASHLPVRGVQPTISERSSEEIVRQSGIAVRKSRLATTTMSREERMSQQPLIATRIQSRDSFTTFIEDSLLKKKGGKRTDGQTQKAPPLSAILRTVWPTLDKKSRAQLVIGLILCLITAACQPAFSVLFAQLIGSFWAKSNPQGEARTWGIYLSIVAVIEGITTFGAYLLMERTGQVWVNTLRAEAFSRILSQPKSWFDKANHSPGRISECLDWSAEEMRKLVSQFVPILVIVTTMVGSSLVWAMIIRWDLTLVALAGLPPSILGARFNSTISDKWEGICHAAAMSTSAIFSEAFSNIRVVRALTLERYFARKHSESVSSAYTLGKRRAAYAGFWYGLYQAIPFFITSLVFWYGCILLRAGQLQVTDVSKVMNLLLFSMGNSILLLGAIPQLAAAKNTALQMLYYAHLSHTAGHEHTGTGRLPSPLPVRLTSLRFAYPSRPTAPVLHSLSLRIDPGTSTAIVGASGCGKSTIAALLLRLYEPDAWSALQRPPTHHLHPSSPKHGSWASSPLDFGGRPAHALDTTHLRSQCAYVPQQPVLFPGTIKENILYGLPETSQLVYNLLEASRQAGLHDFVSSLAEGYNTPVGDGSGIALSGGQMQRVAIARALVRQPKLLVLDEPTSSLDAGAAEEMRHVIRDLVREKGREMAVVVVTHSKEMMKVADRVAVVEGGVVVEMGDYEELVGRRGSFTKLVGGESEIGKERRRKRAERRRNERRVCDGWEKGVEAEMEEIKREDVRGEWPLNKVVNDQALRRLEGKTTSEVREGSRENRFRRRE